MKTLSIIIVLALLLVSCHATRDPATSGQTITANLDPNLTKTYVWPEVGITITVLKGWRRSDNGEGNARSWIASDSSEFVVSVNDLEPLVSSGKVANRSIEEDTTDFYEMHKKYGSEDLKYINVDGVKGVHYLRDEKGYDAHQNSQDEKWIIWKGQRMYAGQRQVIHLNVTSPSQSFAKNRDLFYSLLASIKFNPSDTTPSASVTPATEQLPNVVVVVISESELYLNRRRTDRAQIPAELDKLLRDRPSSQQVWYLKATPEVTCDTVIRLRDDVAALGYGQVGLVAGKGNQATPKTTSRPQPSDSPEETSKSSNPPANKEDQSRFDVHLGLSKTGTLIIKVNEPEVLLSQLANKTRTFLQNHPDSDVIINVAATVSYGSLMSVMGELKTGGAEAIVLKLVEG